MLHSHLKPPSFALSTIPQHVGKLTDLQKNILNAVWAQLVATTKPLPKRALSPVLGKTTLKAAFQGLHRGQIYESSEDGENCFTLTTHGALLTEDGAILADLLVRMTALVKDLFLENSHIKSVSHVDIQQRLQTSGAEMRKLFMLLRLGTLPEMPFYLSSWGPQDVWHITVTDEVMALNCAESIESYLDERIGVGYKDDASSFNDEYMRTQWPIDASSKLFDQAFGVAQTAVPAAALFVSQSRLDEIAKLDHTNFDCTRLACMLSELNECAERKNAHATIMLIRAILDHVPPAFGFGSFAEVASNYGGGGSSFKKSLERLDKHAREVANRLLHMPIRGKEVAPQMNEVSFGPELETMLAEFCRLMKIR